MISAKEVSDLERKRELAKKEYYKALLEQFCKKIRVASELGSKDTILTVPPFLIGFPKYDLSMTVQYMCRQLQRLGYTVYLVGPLDIRVEWSKSRKTPEELEEKDPLAHLPSLANLKKTADKIRKK